MTDEDHAFDERMFIVEQTEQFRVRATSKEEAVKMVADLDPDHPAVEWICCTHREATPI